jgi:hypothetical protein
MRMPPAAKLPEQDDIREVVDFETAYQQDDRNGAQPPRRDVEAERRHEAALESGVATKQP